MGRDKTTLFLSVLLTLAPICTGAEYCPIGTTTCPSLPVKNLTCYNDFYRTITCEWNSTSESHHNCSIHAVSHCASLKASCKMKPDVFKPAIKRCSLTFSKLYSFNSYENMSLDLSCNNLKQSLSINYIPKCHIKVNPPGKPHVNLTTVSWHPQIPQHIRIKDFETQLEWKQQDKSWDDASVQIKISTCKNECKVELDTELLMQGETYEARARVKSTKYSGTWSDWSPTELWVSSVGEIKPSGKVHTWNMVLVGSGVVLVILLCFFLKNKKSTWVIVLKRISGPPLPNPAKSENIHSWLNPYFTSESFYSLKPEKIDSLEVNSTKHAVKPYGLDVKMLKNKLICKSTGSNFSNPSYSELCSSSPVSSLTAGNLLPCEADSPYGPSAGQGGGKISKPDSEDVAEKLKLLSNAISNTEPVQVITDYEKIEKLHHEDLMLKSVDSDMCISGEVTQEATETQELMEGDIIKKADGHDKCTPCKEEKDGCDGMTVDFQRIFRSSGGIFGKDSIQVCSDYEQVPRRQGHSPELPSVDSGVSSGGEEHESQEESMEIGDESTCFPPPHPSVFSSSLLPLTQKSFNSGVGDTIKDQVHTDQGRVDRNLQVEAKRRVAQHRQSVSATGGGQCTPEPTPLDTKIASILGTASVCGVVSEREGDTDLAETKEESVDTTYFVMSPIAFDESVLGI
ncbi:uncharacterized protein LOC133461605 [Cololabis saira]|uniref:uncharacterized protein LOC133461605 n=1 Tax=Cololabis saira TaxID=129043 RepID=UPI002AD3B96E|nr:uncharacterized protein LOC133461605 [Cololabis saira]